METKVIYLDNAATTKPYNKVVEKFSASQNHYFNPSALYQQACDGATTIKDAKKSILKPLCCNAESAADALYAISKNIPDLY